MNNRYRNILFRIILLISSIDCLIMLAWRNLNGILICAVMGVLIGIILWKIHSRPQQPVNKVIKVIGLIVSLLICYNLEAIFYQVWMPSRKIETIANLLSINAEILIYVLAFVAFPSVIFTIIKIIQWLIYFWKLIDIRKVWKLTVSSFKMKSLLTIIINVIGASILGTILLIGVYRLPIELIESNVSSSAETFEEEGKYPSLFFWSTSQLDNFTDAIMMMEAADDTDDSATNKAMLVYRGLISDFGSFEAYVAHYINGREYDTVTTYPRYWHGYQVVLKPLLEFMDYQSIRVLNTVVQLLLVVLVSSLLVWRKMKGYVIPYLLSYLMLMPAALAKSMQFSTCFYIFTFAMIVLLLLKGKVKSKSIYFIFLNIGIATAFFDFFTYPIATFGVPALLYLYMRTDDVLEQKLSNLLKSLLCWGAGYAGMWSLKWVFASLITGNNVILNALHSVLGRVSHSSADGSTHYTILQCEVKNIATFLTTPFTLFVLVFIVLLAARILKNNYLTYSETCKRLLPYIIIAVMPFLWYAFATNHSAIHYWFTNKTCVVSILAIMCGLAELNSFITKNEEKGDMEK